MGWACWSYWRWHDHHRPDRRPLQPAAAVRVGAAAVGDDRRGSILRGGCVGWEAHPAGREQGEEKVERGEMERETPRPPSTSSLFAFARAPRRPTATGAPFFSERKPRSHLCMLARSLHTHVVPRPPPPTYKNQNKNHFLAPQAICHHESPGTVDGRGTRPLRGRPQDVRPVLAQD